MEAPDLLKTLIFFLVGVGVIGIEDQPKDRGARVMSSETQIVDAVVWLAVKLVFLRPSRLYHKLNYMVDVVMM